LPLYEKARDLRKAALGEKHAETACSVNNLAFLYQEKGDYKAALPLFEQARDAFREALGEKHPLYAASLNHLAQLYQDMGDYRAALPLFEQSLEIRKEALGDKHPDYPLALKGLAGLHLLKGNPRAALPLAEEATTCLAGHLDRTFAVQSDRQRLRLLRDLTFAVGVHLSAAAGADAPARQRYAAPLA